MSAPRWNLETATALSAYVRSINNREKRSYAARYSAFLRDGGEEPSTGSLSYMGAQSARLRMAEIMREYGEEASA